mmetsp:Transcript_150378/g.287993  ORF Transcript_150378/g.287993 Transcript_150378/m.287993 type:complete len:154 (-) Transcript_150378:59-520(-)
MAMQVTATLHNLFCIACFLVVAGVDTEAEHRKTPRRALMRLEQSESLAAAKDDPHNPEDACPLKLMDFISAQHILSGWVCGHNQRCFKGAPNNVNSHQCLTWCKDNYTPRTNDPMIHALTLNKTDCCCCEGQERIAGPSTWYELTCLNSGAER